jgi:RecA/RadA recombinase
VTKFISTGSTLLDLALGGGVALGSVSAIYGKQATGKSLIAGELATNFLLDYPDGKIFYLDCEAAFNPDYAEKINLPVEAIEFVDEKTVEGFFKALSKELKDLPEGVPALFILDSLDDLTTEAEDKRDISDGTYGDKAKKLSEVFRRINVLLKKADMALFIVGQVRDDIGKIGHGPATKMGGGHSVKFHSSQTVKLEQVGKGTKEITFDKEEELEEENIEDVETEEDDAKSKVKKKVKAVKKAKSAQFTETRVTEIEVRATVEKNRFGPPYVTSSFTIKFEYGIDDVASCLQYLSDRGKLKNLDCAGGLIQVSSILKKVEALPADQNRAAKREIKELTKKTYKTIADRFGDQDRPSKY